MILSFDLWHAHTGIGCTLIIREKDETLSFITSTKLAFTGQIKLFGKELNWDVGETEWKDK